MLTGVLTPADMIQQSNALSHLHKGIMDGGTSSRLYVL